jgi:hypothetical protein
MSNTNETTVKFAEFYKFWKLSRDFICQKNTVENEFCLTNQVIQIRPGEINEFLILARFPDLQWIFLQKDQAWNCDPCLRKQAPLFLELKRMTDGIPLNETILENLVSNQMTTCPGPKNSISKSDGHRFASLGVLLAISISSWIFI